jgi:hypothetical protein
MRWASLQLTDLLKKYAVSRLFFVQLILVSSKNHKSLITGHE